MDREEAAAALSVLRKVVAQTRDNTALQNYGVIWIVQGAANLAGFLATHYLFSQGYTEPPPFLALWVPIILIDVVVVFLLRKQRVGARTFVDTQLWSIWTAFIGAVVLTAILNHTMGLEAFFLGPVIGVLAAVAFASMGSLMSPRWYIGTVLFGGTAVAMAVWHEIQFLVLGLTWGAAQISGGVFLDRARRRRLATSDEAKVV